MSIDEMVEIAEEARKLCETGDLEGAGIVLKRFPVAPAVANVYKEKMGVPWLLEQGWNLSRAEEAYGKDWLK
jgi:hypothetical protein